MTAQHLESGSTADFYLERFEKVIKPEVFETPETLESPNAAVAQEVISCVDLLSGLSQHSNYWRKFISKELEKEHLK